MASKDTEEVWILIWSYLDFIIVQNICSCVSKSWLKMIRSSKLSWEMKFRQKFSYDLVFLAVDDFNAISIHWENLRVLHFSYEVEFVNLHLSYGLSSHKSLENIVIPCGLGLFTNDTLWGVVTRYWLDPRHIFAPDTVKNAIKLKIYIEIRKKNSKCNKMVVISQTLKPLKFINIPPVKRIHF